MKHVSLLDLFFHVKYLSMYNLLFWNKIVLEVQTVDFLISKYHLKPFL